MPRVSNFFFLQIIKMLMAYFNIIVKSPVTALNFLKLEKMDGKSLRLCLENLYLNSKILDKDLDWLHFCFTTTTFRKENIAQSINAKMGVSLRGYDINIYPKNHNCYSSLWKKVDKVHSISYSLLKKAEKYGLNSSVKKEVIFPAIDTKNLISKDL